MSLSKIHQACFLLGISKIGWSVVNDEETDGDVESRLKSQTANLRGKENADEVSRSTSFPKDRKDR